MTGSCVRRSVLETHDLLIFDLDGTVYRGEEPIAGASEVLSSARKNGTTVRFVTNNASRGPEEVRATLHELRIDAADDEIYTSARAGALTAADLVSVGAPVLVVGSPALAHEVRCAGLRPVFTADPPPSAIVQGLSPAITWHELAEATIAVRSGARWVACNNDITLPSARGLLPGNGSLVGVVRAATDRTPVVAGKPGRALFDYAVAGTQARRPLVVGDRLDTDIAGASAAGLDSMLVLSGVSSPGDLLAAAPTSRPRYVSADVSGLFGPSVRAEIAPHPDWRVEISGAVATLSGRPGRTHRPESLGALRALCAAWWSAGGGRPELVAENGSARSALRGLGLLNDHAVAS